MRKLIIPYKLQKERREYICSIIPTCIVIISSLINRYEHAKAQLTVTKVNELLSKMNISIIDNSNITRDHLGKKGLHLNPRGIGKIAVNFVKSLRNL